MNLSGPKEQIDLDCKTSFYAEFIAIRDEKSTNDDDQPARIFENSSMPFM